MPVTAWVRSRMAAVISAGVKTTGAGAAEVTDTGKSGALAVVAIGRSLMGGSGWAVARTLSHRSYLIPNW